MTADDTLFESETFQISQDAVGCEITPITNLTELPEFLKRLADEAKKLRDGAGRYR